MDEVIITNRYFRHEADEYNLCLIEDILNLELTPQEIDPDLVFTPEVSLVVENTQDTLLLIHLARSESNKYYYGYLYLTNRQEENRRPSFVNTPEADTIVACVFNALEHIEGKFGKAVKKMVTEAHHRVNSCRLRQISIFDMLD